MTIEVYGPAIRDAIRRGDLNDMLVLLRQARKTRREQGDLDQAIKRLDAAVARLAKKRR
jgi:hypothetical protein